jgi:hypothetical protein
VPDPTTTRCTKLTEVPFTSGVAAAKWQKHRHNRTGCGIQYMSMRDKDGIPCSQAQTRNQAHLYIPPDLVAVVRRTNRIVTTCGLFLFYSQQCQCSSPVDTSCYGNAAEHMNALNPSMIIMTVLSQWGQPMSLSEGPRPPEDTCRVNMHKTCRADADLRSASLLPHAGLAVHNRISAPHCTANKHSG